MDIHSIHPLRQPDYANRCGGNRGGCSHLCLPNRSGYTCACPPGLQLTPGGRTCSSQPGELLVFAQKHELRLFPLNVTGEVDHVLPLSGVRSAVALDWDGASKFLVSLKAIDGSLLEVVVECMVVTSARKRPIDIQNAKMAF